MKKLNNTNNIALAGEFAVLSALNLRGWNASLTLGNTKGVDILAYKGDAANVIKIEVKTSSYKETFGRSEVFGRTISWRMDEKHETLSKENLFYCFVRWSIDIKDLQNEKEDIVPIFYIVPSKVVAKYISEENAFWRKEKNKDINFSHPMRNFRLGLVGEEYKIETPKLETYKNAWNLLSNDIKDEN